MNVFIDVDGLNNYFRGEMIINQNRMQPGGRGIMKFDNKSIYEGQWLDGKRCGFGRLIQENGNMYEG